ncbi:hypothetical protein V8B55DRAFT_1568927 [Mucor lusitanicus]|uniref:Uncharacterized protein n=1 Tax=Mucor lusitanicus CBS 277.49 TaxID=747725 RepID=A0A162QFT7_MUCCL|nr:hypothetical protein MUCCIDRAFT_111024 [Mucor lusitanicus CBS 277.49]
MKLQFLFFLSLLSVLVNVCHCKWEAYMVCGTWKMISIRHVASGTNQAVTWSDQQNHESDMICSDDESFCVYRVSHSPGICSSIGWKFQIKYQNTWAYDNQLTLGSSLPSSGTSVSGSKEFTLRFP